MALISIPVAIIERGCAGRHTFERSKNVQERPPGERRRRGDGEFHAQIER